MEHQFSLNRRQTTIGRSATNDLSISADSRVDRRHAYIVEEAGQHVIHDANSTNGTWVNDIPVTRHVLSPGDRIRVGETTLTYTGQGLQLPESAPLVAAASATSILSIAAIIGGIMVVGSSFWYFGSSRQSSLGTSTATPRASGTQDVVAVVAKLDQHLRDSGYIWQPSRNAVADLPPEERRKRLGALVQPPSVPTLPPGATATKTGADGMATAIRRATQLAEATPRAQTSATVPGGMLPPPDEPPLTLDYRPFGTSIRDQEGCGSCWAHACIAVMETQLRRATPGLESELDLSEQRLVSCRSGSCGGNTIDSGLDFLVREGTVDEACNPYRAEDNPAWCPTLCSGSPPIHASDFGLAAPPRTVCSSVPDHRDDAWNSEVMEALATDGPLVAVMSVPEDFFYYGYGIYRTSDFFDSSGEPGCHAVALVGYSLPGRYWLIKNSWGTSWGEDGFARISWDDERAHVGGMLYRLALGSPSPTPTAAIVTIASPSATATADASPRPSTPTPIQPPEASSTWTATPLPPPSTLTPPPSSTPEPYPNPYP